MSVGLIGYRGSGKTTIGKRLANRLWQTFIDTDELVVKKSERKNIKEIFEIDGEKKFRELETEVLREIVDQPDTVIALGGGALNLEENRHLIRKSGVHVVYLKCEPAELLKRIEADPESKTSRPNLTDAGGIAEIEEILVKREPVWRSMAHAELEVTYLTPEDAVPYVVRLM